MSHIEVEVGDWVSVTVGMLDKDKVEDDGDGGKCETNANSSSSFPGTTEAADSMAVVSVWHRCAWSMAERTGCGMSAKQRGAV